MKNPIFSVLVIYICIISLVAVFVTIADKIKAKRKKWRTPESVLLLFSALGGSLAMYLTMLLIRHKTKHPKFMIGIPLIMLIQAAALFYLYTKFPFFG